MALPIVSKKALYELQEHLTGWAFSEESTASSGRPRFL